MERRLNPTIKIEFCNENAKLPQYIHQGDAGMDVYAAEEVLIAPGETKAVKLGFKAAIPEGYEVQIRPRSGLSLKTRLRMPNSVGTIDAGYRDEWAVLLYNCSTKVDDNYTEEILTCFEKNNRAGTYKICVGDRIAQIVVAEVCRASWQQCRDIADIGFNRGGGFGSSGHQ